MLYFTIWLAVIASHITLLVGVIPAFLIYHITERATAIGIGADRAQIDVAVDVLSRTMVNEGMRTVANTQAILKGSITYENLEREREKLRNEHKYLLQKGSEMIVKHALNHLAMLKEGQKADIIPSVWERVRPTLQWFIPVNIHLFVVYSFILLCVGM